MIGLTRYIELVVINRYRDVNFGGNRRELFDPADVGTVLACMQAVAIPDDYDIWWVSDGKLISANRASAVENEDVFVLTNKAFQFTDEQAAAAFNALRPIMPSRWAVFREGST